VKTVNEMIAALLALIALLEGHKELSIIERAALIRAVSKSITG